MLETGAGDTGAGEGPAVAGCSWLLGTDLLGTGVGDEKGAAFSFKTLTWNTKIKRFLPYKALIKEKLAIKIETIDGDNYY